MIYTPVMGTRWTMDSLEICCVAFSTLDNSLEMEAPQSFRMSSAPRSGANRTTPAPVYANYVTTMARLSFRTAHLNPVAIGSRITVGSA